MTYETGNYGYRAMCRMAARVYIRRQLGEEEPHGKRIGHGLWCPEPYEWQSCCDEFVMRANFISRNFERHCCSLKHVAAVYELPLADVRAALREIRKG